MKMFWIIYAGPRPARVTDALLAHGAAGYTEFPKAHGTGTHGRVQGTRAWPGEETVITSVVAAEASAGVADGLVALQNELAAGERLHFAVLPVETFR
ncbi:MAG: hypothetical protein HYV19_03590 [Gemmatimonadetes bacterium]|nr:hypothetical protein [Gemmatimonadota bacterium]